MATQQVNGREVSYPGKGGTLKAYVAEAAGGGPRPAVIVVQEWWGLDEHIKDIARRFAAEGYFAVAPDLYSRQGHKVTKDPNVAGELMGNLKQSDGIDDLLSTVDWIKAQGGAQASRIGVIGFCMGGSYATALPCVSRDIKAAAPFYGEIPSDDRLQNLNCPIFYAYGENDGWIQRKDVDRLASTLKKFNKPGEVKVYGGCSHGFFNDTRADIYSAKDAKDAWERSLKLFEQNLKQ
ncbi:MAG TPA: dienelactone hydrolase family protein [Candidatus Binataceae bacterium]|nr:dienelactone hydrolase family protein [Candidatus Binataceae bacterium]